MEDTGRTGYDPKLYAQLARASDHAYKAWTAANDAYVGYLERYHEEVFAKSVPIKQEDYPLGRVRRGGVGVVYSIRFTAEEANLLHRSMGKSVDLMKYVHNAALEVADLRKQLILARSLVNAIKRYNHHKIDLRLVMNYVDIYENGPLGDVAQLG